MNSITHAYVPVKNMTIISSTTAHLFISLNIVSLLLAKDVPVTFSNPFITLLLAPLFEITKYPTKLTEVNNNKNPTKITPAYSDICTIKLFTFSIPKNTSPPNISPFLSNPVPFFPASLVSKYTDPAGRLLTSPFFSVSLSLSSLFFFSFPVTPLNSLLLSPFSKSNPYDSINPMTSLPYFSLLLYSHKAFFIFSFLLYLSAPFLFM